MLCFLMFHGVQRENKILQAYFFHKTPSDKTRYPFENTATSVFYYKKLFKFELQL